MLRYHVKMPKYSLFICYPLSMFSSLCGCMFSTFISPPSPLLYVIGSVMSWFGFLFLPQAYFFFFLPSPSSSHVPLPFSAILFSSLNASSPPKDFPGCLFFTLFFFSLTLSAFIVFIFPWRRRIQRTATPWAVYRSCSCSARVVLICLKGVKNV